MINVYYTIDIDDSMWWVEKSYFDKNQRLNDNDGDPMYINIENALSSIDCPRLMEANAELLISEEEMITKMAEQGFNMIINDKIL